MPVRTVPYFFLIILLFSGCFVSAQKTRQVINFDNDWKFFLGNDSLAMKTDFDDHDWRILKVPHDWSIESDFLRDAPATNQGGALPGGIGWYRKKFSLPADAAGKKIFIQFDGVYRNSQVWINGHYLGERPYGYSSFQYDLTPYLAAGGGSNTIAVKVDNSLQPNSRWYSGSGIYRNVRLVAVNRLAYIKQWGTFVTTPVVDKTEATVDIQTEMESSIKAKKILTVSFDVYDDKNNLITTGGKSTLSRLTFSGPSVTNNYQIKIARPKLWSVNTPHLYRLMIRLRSGKQLIDQYETSFGIRRFHFDREKGFFLNGEYLKIKGVCLHHDQGALGAAFNYHAAARQLRMLKDMGANAIRTAHNPPAPEFLDLCDSMGFLVMDEAFDMWEKKKTKYDYSLDFKKWHQRDLEDMILRDRNHPSVFMWSIGNEIREQFDSSGIRIARELTGIVKNLDTTRPVTSALTETDTTKNFIYQSDALDIPGWNYKEWNYPDVLKKYPGKIFIASETTSALETRGVYDMPSDSIQIWPPKGQKVMENVNGDWSVSAYDNIKSNWGSTHEETWKIVKKYDFLSGLFIWTGFDYLGEPTPFPFPARSSYFGIIDLAGLPKDVYYMYQSEWTDQPVLHIFPHWNWKPGQMIDVWAYYNQADEVELFLNDRSLGIRRKTGDDLHVVWHVPFQPGTLRAVSRKSGKVVLTKEIKTAGEPSVLTLSADRNHLSADGVDLSYITVTVEDAEGNLAPNADNLVRFSINGPGIIAGTDNGYQADTTTLKSPVRKVWKGKSVAIIMSTDKPGVITVTAESDGLKPAVISLSATK